MTIRERAPRGAPCWADLWTSDVEGSRRFYSEVFGWEAEEPSPEFGGYLNFVRRGRRTAGCMGDMGDVRANDTWKIYLATPDIEETAKSAVAAGAEMPVPPGAVADLGSQVVLQDPNGATIGAWQPGTFEGFTVLGEHGSPSWFELQTRNHSEAVDFYRRVFHWETSVVSDTDEFRYSTVRDPGGGEDLAGIADASSWMPEGAPAQWSVYWEVDDIDATVARITSLGGSLSNGPDDTPYGRLAVATDPAGAEIKLRRAPR